MNDIIGILLDMDNNRITYHKNGSYADGSGNFDESSPTAYISFTNSTMGFAFGDGADCCRTQNNIAFYLFIIILIFFFFTSLTISLMHFSINFKLLDLITNETPILPCLKNG